MTTYVVCNIEADGSIPGPHSMISLGTVAVNQAGKELGEFEINFHFCYLIVDKTI